MDMIWSNETANMVFTKNSLYSKIDSKLLLLQGSFGISFDKLLFLI